MEAFLSRKKVYLSFNKLLEVNTFSKYWIQISMTLIFKLNFYCLTFISCFFGVSIHSDQYKMYKGKPQYLAKAFSFLIKLKSKCCKLLLSKNVCKKTFLRVLKVHQTLIYKTQQHFFVDSALKYFVPCDFISNCILALHRKTEMTA